MAPIDVTFIITGYEGIKNGGNTMSVVSKCFALVDGGVSFSIQSAVQWLVEKILDDRRDEMILACLIMLEYWTREKTDWAHFKRAISLKNHCGVCHLKGHNKQNCSSALVRFLNAEGLAGKVNDALDLMTE